MYILQVIGGALSVLAGIGGAYMRIPLFAILLKYSLTKATGISYALTYGSAFPIFFFSIFTAHPEKKEIGIIDYNVTIQTVSVLFIGT